MKCVRDSHPVFIIQISIDISETGFFFPPEEELSFRDLGDFHPHSSMDFIFNRVEFD